MASDPSNIAEEILRFREGALGMRDQDPKKANNWHDKMQASYKILRESEAGRQALISLLSDADPQVRCSAAARSLQWISDIARTVLEELRDSGGVCSFDAEIILQEYDKGRLSFEY